MHIFGMRAIIIGIVTVGNYGALLFQVVKLAMYIGTVVIERVKLQYFFYSPMTPYGIIVFHTPIKICI